MRMFLAAILTWGCVLATPLQAQMLSLAQIGDYLLETQTLKGRFTQFNADGSQDTGTLSLRRPGRMRFEYDPPNKNLVIAGEGQVAIFDGKSNQTPAQYPLHKTPLRLILLSDGALDGDTLIAAHYEKDATTRLILRDPQTPEAGMAELVFSHEPAALLGWILTDELGNQTVVQLESLQSGVQIPAITFSISAEINARGLN